jgi:hypothetical protein
MEAFMGISQDGDPVDTEEDCVEFANAIISGFAIAQYKESIAKGRMEYDGEAAAACVAVLENVTCATYNNEIVPTDGGCRSFTLPKVADGGGCTQDYECISNNCIGEENSLGEPSVDGACMPMPAEGESCDELDDNCEGDLICDADFGSGDSTCRAARPDGTQCNLDDDCASDYCDEDSGLCGPEPVTCDGR